MNVRFLLVYIALFQFVFPVKAGNNLEKKECYITLLEEILFDYKQDECASLESQNSMDLTLSAFKKTIESKNYKECLTQLSNSPISQELVFTIRGNILERQYNLDSAKSEYQKALSTTDKELEKLLLYKLLDITLKLGDTTSYHQVLSKYHNLSLTIIDSARILKVKGNDLLINGSYEESIKLFMKSLAIFHQLKNTQEVLELYNLIGANYAQAKFFDEAQAYFRKGLKLAQESNSLNQLAKFETNLGGLFMETKVLDSAESHLIQALSRNLALNNYRGIASSYSSLGSVYFMRCEEELAINNIKNALVFAEKSKDLSMMTAANIQLGKLYLSTGKTSLAIKYQKNANHLAQKNNYKRALMVSHIELSKAYSKLKSYDSAYYHKELGDKLEDELIGAKKSNLISEIRIGYEKELKQKENEKLTIQLQARRKQLIYLIVGGLITVLFILFIIYYLYKMNVKNKQLVSIQKKKIKMKEEQVVKSEHKIDELNSLLKLQKKDDVATSELTSQAIEQLINTKNWSVFMVEFNGVYEDFVLKINQLHPTITPKDLRIIALIKMNLLDKEIADILNIEYSSFRKAKSRLKKKLEIDETISLSQYIFTL